MRVDKYIEQMERVFYGTAFIDLEYEEQFGRHFEFTKPSKGHGTTCPHCKVGIPADIKAKKGNDSRECPYCHKTFRIQLKTTPEGGDNCVCGKDQAVLQVT